VTVATKNGECNINITLDLNINLTTAGLELTSGKSNGVNSIREDENEDKVDWAIPDFSPSSKLQFGKGE